MDTEQLFRYLRPRLSQLGYEIAQLVNTNFDIVRRFDSLPARAAVEGLGSAHQQICRTFCLGRTDHHHTVQTGIAHSMACPGFFWPAWFWGRFSNQLCRTARAGNPLRTRTARATRHDSAGQTVPADRVTLAGSEGRAGQTNPAPTPSTGPTGSFRPTSAARDVAMLP